MKTLIVIPAYNEALNIERVIRRLTETAGSIDYVIIDDGSSDQTADICRENGFNYISHPVNLGLSAAVQTGFIYALKNGYDAVIQFDGDGQHRGEYIREMEKRIEEGCDIVIGSRFVTEKKPADVQQKADQDICGKQPDDAGAGYCVPPHEAWCQSGGSAGRDG